MNIQEKQYYEFFTQLGYDFNYYPDRKGFDFHKLGIYAKICEHNPSADIVALAKEASHKKTIVLLDGNLTFKAYQAFEKGEEICEHLFVEQGHKFHPIYYGEFDVDYFNVVAETIAEVIHGEIVCKRCGSVNDFSVTKPSIHYRADCKSCGSWITNISENKPTQIYFGKFKGRFLNSMGSHEELHWLKWAIDSGAVKGKVKNDFIAYLATK